MVMTVRVPLRFSDFDTNKHINNVAYFALMETARISFLQRLREEKRLGRTLIVHAEIDYLREVRVGNAHVDIDLGITKVGSSSLTISHAISDSQGVAARGTAVLVAVDREGSSRPLTDEERDGLAHYVS